MSHAELRKYYTKTAANGESSYSYRTILFLLFTKILEENKVEQIEFSVLLIDLTAIAMCVFWNTFENLPRYFQITPKI